MRTPRPAGAPVKQNSPLRPPPLAMVQEQTALPLELDCISTYIPFMPAIVLSWDGIVPVKEFPQRCLRNMTSSGHHHCTCSRKPHNSPQLQKMPAGSISARRPHPPPHSERSYPLTIQSYSSLCLDGVELCPQGRWRIDSCMMRHPPPLSRRENHAPLLGLRIKVIKCFGF